MDIIHDRARPKSSALPLILLPGAYTHAREFVTHGFISSTRVLGRVGDIAAIETGMDVYLDGSAVRRLHETIVPIRAGCERVWLAGISLGGFGALLYAMAHPEAVAGILLLSPFIGTRGSVAQVIRAGGFHAWQPEGDPATSEHQVLQWLKTYRFDDPAWPDIYLGYGRDDRFAASYRLFAELLPPERVVTAAGGHDWKTWTVLWEQLLGVTQFGVA